MGTKLATIRHPKKRAYLAALAKCGLVGKAACAAGVDRHTPNEWRKDPLFAELEEAAKDSYAEILEEEADRRAVQGTEKLKFDKHGDPLYDPRGEGQIYVEREFSDALLMFRLKALKPNTYRENFRVAHTGPGNGVSDGPVEIVVHYVTEPTPSELTDASRGSDPVQSGG